MLETANSGVPKAVARRGFLRRRTLVILQWIIGAALAGSRSTAAERRPTPLEHQVYVWQRAWNEPVREALSTRGGPFSRWMVLGAEIHWKAGTPQVTQVEADFAHLAKTRKAVGLALRVGAFGGPFQNSSRELDALKAALHEEIRRAKASGVEPAELQLDFDCASSKLAGYRVWIQALKREFTPYPLTLTALPDWLGKPGFLELARASDGFVLQVHSLKRPTSFAATFSPCDPNAARRAALQASQMSIPFFIALPTYGYLCAFDEKDRFLGLSAEGPRPDWPTGTRLKEIRSDERSIAGLVREWTAQPPPGLRGVIWYRLPVDGDRLNWSWPTLQSVIAGKAPTADLKAELVSEDSLLFEIDLLNRGTSDAIQPAQIRLQWRGSRLVAADGLAGFQAEDAGPATLRFSSPTGSFRLEPGRRQRVGWARFSKPTEVSIEVSSPAR